jgi:GntR family transcriptional regulator/MocR family aminotransferase
MSASRRQELLAWARQCEAYVIEDDYDGEYRFDVAPIPTLQTLDGARNVIYLGTVSKTLSPTLRLGYLVVPPALSAAFRTAKRLADRHTPSLEQEALADLIACGAYERHVRRARRRNGERRDALLTALQTELGDAVRVVGADAGLHVVAWLTPFPMDREAALVAAAREAGVGVYPVTPLYAPLPRDPLPRDPSSRDPASRPDPPDADRPNHPGLVIGYASLDQRDIARGVARLAAVLRAAATGW